MRRSRASFDEADDFSCLRLHNAVLGCRDLDAACSGVANDASCLVRMAAQHSDHKNVHKSAGKETVTRRNTCARTCKWTQTWFCMKDTSSM